MSYMIRNPYCDMIEVRDEMTGELMGFSHSFGFDERPFFEVQRPSPVLSGPVCSTQVTTHTPLERLMIHVHKMMWGKKKIQKSMYVMSKKDFDILIARGK